MSSPRKLDFKAADSTPLWCQVWDAQALERARLYVIHGLGSAATEFMPLGRKLSMRGITVICANQRGDGYDPVVSRRGRFFDVDQINNDFEALLIATNAKASSVPLFLLGESMGALLALNFLKERSTRHRSNEFELVNGESRKAIVQPARSLAYFSGSILLCPVVQLACQMPWILRQLAYLASTLFPNLVLSPSLFVHGKAETPQLTSDGVYQEAVKVAPHYISSYSLRCTTSMGRLMNQVLTDTDTTSLPLLVLGGANDIYIRPDQLKNWFDRLKCNDKTLYIFPKSYHLLLHDIENADVLAIIGEWLEKRLGAGIQMESK